MRKTFGCGFLCIFGSLEIFTLLFCLGFDDCLKPLQDLAPPDFWNYISFEDEGGLFLDNILALVVCSPSLSDSGLVYWTCLFRLIAVCLIGCLIRSVLPYQFGWLQLGKTLSSYLLLMDASLSLCSGFVQLQGPALHLSVTALSAHKCS